MQYVVNDIAGLAEIFEFQARQVEDQIKVGIFKGVANKASARAQVTTWLNAAEIVRNTVLRKPK